MYFPILNYIIPNLFYMVRNIWYIKDSIIRKKPKIIMLSDSLTRAWMRQYRAVLPGGCITVIEPGSRLKIEEYSQASYVSCLLNFWFCSKNYFGQPHFMIGD